MIEERGLQSIHIFSIFLASIFLAFLASIFLASIFLAFSEKSIWIPRVLAVIHYGFLASLWIFTGAMFQKLASFLIFGSFMRRHRGQKSLNFAIFFDIFKAPCLITWGYVPYYFLISGIIRSISSSVPRK